METIDKEDKGGVGEGKKKNELKAEMRVQQLDQRHESGSNLIFKFRRTD